MARRRRTTTDQDGQRRSKERKEEDEIKEMDDKESSSQEGEEHDSECNNSYKDELPPSGRKTRQRSQSKLRTAAAEMAPNAPS